MSNQERGFDGRRESVYGEFKRIFDPNIRGSDRWRYITNSIAVVSAPVFAIGLAAAGLSHNFLIFGGTVGVLAVGFSSSIISRRLSKHA